MIFRALGISMDRDASGLVMVNARSMPLDFVTVKGLVMGKGIGSCDG